MSAFVLIDTSAWIFALGSKPIPRIRKRIEGLVEENLAAITSPIAFELLSGTRSEEDAKRLWDYLSSLHPFPFSAEEWTDAAIWTSLLRKQGSKVKTVDALIAYKATKHNLTLLHTDRDLDRIAQKCSLKVESYVADVRLHNSTASHP